MSFKTCAIKTAIKWTPKVFVLWGGNFVLRGVAKLTDFRFDLDARQVYVQVRLYGEPDVIEVWVEDFAIIGQKGAHSFIIQQARSNRLWLNNLLARLVRKAWAIPDMPQLRAQIELAADLLRLQGPGK